MGEDHHKTYFWCGCPTLIHERNEEVSVKVFEKLFEMWVFGLKMF